MVTSALEKLVLSTSSTIRVAVTWMGCMPLTKLGAVVSMALNTGGSLTGLTVMLKVVCR